MIYSLVYKNSKNIKTFKMYFHRDFLNLHFFPKYLLSKRQEKIIQIEMYNKKRCAKYKSEREYFVVN